MKNLCKIFLTLLLFVVRPSGTTALVEKNEPQKEEVKAKKKKKKRGKAFFFAVYCIACYVICPFVFYFNLKKEIDAQKTLFIKEGILEFDRQFDKAVKDEINRRKQDSYISCVLYERLEYQLKEFLEKEKQREIELLETQLTKLFDVIKEEYENEQKQLIMPWFFLSPLSLPVLALSQLRFFWCFKTKETEKCIFFEENKFLVFRVF